LIIAYSRDGNKGKLADIITDIYKWHEIVINNSRTTSRV